MSEGSEVNFEDLSFQDQLKAILSCTQEPISEELLLRYAGYDKKNLTPDQQETMDNLLRSSDVISSKNNHDGEVFELSQTGKSTVESLRIDATKIHDRIVKAMGPFLGKYL